MRSQVTIIAKPMYKDHLLATLCHGIATLLTLKAANYFHIQMMGMMPVDIEVWGQVVKRKVVAVQEATLMYRLY